MLPVLLSSLRDQLFRPVVIMPGAFMLPLRRLFAMISPSCRHVASCRGFFFRLFTPRACASVCLLIRCHAAFDFCAAAFHCRHCFQIDAMPLVAIPCHFRYAVADFHLRDDDMRAKRCAAVHRCAVRVTRSARARCAQKTHMMPYFR